MANETANASAPVPEGAQMPPGLGNAYVFQVFNTVSFSIVIGVPMMLFFKQLGASETVLGIAAALTPLLNILQIPAARFVESLGYRKFVLLGWSARSYLIIGMAATGFLPRSIDNTTRIALMLLLLFFYTTSRGVSSCGFLPWMTQLVPEPVRGLYISRDQMSSALALVASLLLNALFLINNNSLTAYGWVFVFGFISAMVSLHFLRKVPDVPVEASAYRRGQVPWRDMLLFPPFFKLMVFNVVVNTGLAASSVFWIPMFRDLFHFSGSTTLFIASLGNITTAACLFFLGRIVDRVGSRPVMALGLAAFTLHFTGWACASSGVLKVNVWSILIIQFLTGVASASFNLANVRLVMGTVPAMGRSHFFALYSVISSLVLGLTPIAWGIFLDTIDTWHAHWFGWEWNKYSFLYVVLVTTMLTGQFFLHRLTESRAMPTDEFMRELLINSPSRAIARLLLRKPLP